MIPLRHYLESETWFAQEVAKGREAAWAGDLLSHEEMKARLADRGINAG
jgi:predicted transcriptional regulator